jgi:hypothetical protein
MESCRWRTRTRPLKWGYGETPSEPSMNWMGGIVGLLFVGLGLSGVRSSIAAGRAPYWRGLSTTYYVDQRKSPALFWLNVSLQIIWLVAVICVFVLGPVGIFPALRVWR